MYQNKLHNKIIITLILVVVSTNSYANTKYEPHECITYVHFDWGDYKGDRFDVLNDLVLYKVMYNIKNFVEKNSIKYLGQRPIRKYGSGAYLQFGDNCKNKTEMSKQIMQQYAKNIPNFPKYFVTEALIMPHRTTFLEKGLD